MQAKDARWPVSQQSSEQTDCSSDPVIHDNVCATNVPKRISSQSNPVDPIHRVQWRRAVERKERNPGSGCRQDSGVLKGDVRRPARGRAKFCGYYRYSHGSSSVNR